ncbi:MAG TPA: 5-carboxymethyl-2-hydroxymuconate Delta-isomerase [Acidobacteriota bacterium]|nr:5-carboxymethyl-2-hydroxymuconate Delta-isomerase [Acidobacteriota bacterium]HNB72537.1 5-carboxymethyl-2-hydroxymuconate Delta-isomerase [Acidobacteriota bacterium]HND19275.1 5-carboxymethyl-2-hydroxymuconate Delta-isomerase [Acidobacteriota bacterium]HNG91622.1 5-carboxymethyl-2-hydroxymuconate Delta-isomerase [Acidobacteriota bacterium]HNJ40484.1 5-carboxymethyl-2-hydroxymuconate Delta-isomerase [Acidobacteriota bacterium]
MPHLTLYYTANLPAQTSFEPLLAQCHSILANVGGVKIGNCKSKAIRIEEFFVADGTQNQAFVHLDLRLLEGRAPELKQDIGKHCLAAIKEAFSELVEHNQVQITVEIRDIVRQNYFKIPADSIAP